jgi:hypothetical protein
MTLRRATLYIGGGTLLVAWFSSAASVSLGRNSRRPSTADRDTSARTDALAVSVQTQARRLAQRLATAPAPQQPTRNPFAFGALPGVRRATPARMAAPEPEPAPLAAAIVEPALVLVGLAERRTGDGVVRSAVISTDGQDLIMAEVGTVLLGQYTVTSIGNDAVELSETSTGRSRRLVLQNP